MTLRDTLLDDEVWLFQARWEHYRSAMEWLHILTVRVFAISLFDHQDWALPKPTCFPKQGGNSKEDEAR